MRLHFAGGRRNAFHRCFPKRSCVGACHKLGSEKTSLQRRWEEYMESFVPHSTTNLFALPTPDEQQFLHSIGSHHLFLQYPYQTGHFVEHQQVSNDKNAANEPDGLSLTGPRNNNTIVQSRNVREDKR